VKFLLLSLITWIDKSKSQQQRLREVVDTAVLGEELGFDGFAVGERHERPFLSSAPPVVLSHIAAKTSRIRLWTGVTTLSLLDPVRAFEDYSTLDNLADGRLELIIGKGNGAAQAQLFHVTTDDQWDRLRESYHLFRQLWRSERVTWEGRYRPSLTGAETWPRPVQQPITVWHGSATSRASVDLAASYGDPLFSANVTNPIEPYAELIDYYRERWAFHGHDPEAIRIGAGSAGFFAAPTTQEAIAAYRPIYQARLAAFRNVGVEPVFPTIEDAVERSSILVGSPQQIIDKVHRYHERFGHEVTHLSADTEGLTEKQNRSSLELFASDIAPVLRQLKGR
jgi:alkanesulfonate monooxygenase SsuD/methylene tetrahydromethanopterin reductase-like flavin-dependent oxidoreductase (luciferase family)